MTNAVVSNLQDLRMNALQRTQVCSTAPTQGKSQITAPSGGKSLSEFAREVGAVIAPLNVWFLKGDTIVEIRELRISERITNIVFHRLTATETRTAIEKFVSIGSNQNGAFVEHSISREVAAALLEATQLKEQLPRVERILDVPIPFLHEGQIVYATKGYDPRFKTFSPQNTPELEDMSVEEAKRWLSELQQDFCFADQTAVTLSIARLITPFCRGLIGHDHRTPLWIFEANRPRSGKDYLAGCTAVLYEGRFNEDAPLDSDSEETKKRITAALQSGRRFMHFANCEGYIRNAAIEHALTASVIGGRKLGSNDAGSDLQLSNEIEYSLSANTGFQYSEDLELRSRKVSLRYFEEDANSRTFTRTDLHGWIKANRGKLLSAIAALVKHWNVSGRPSGCTPFTSFPKWAEVVGGIMTCCGLGDPCIAQTSTSMTGDEVTEHMRVLFRAAYDQFGSAEIGKSDLLSIILHESLFGFWDLTNNRSHQTSFGQKLKAYTGRVLGGIQMRVNDQQRRPRYQFSPEPVQTERNLVSSVLGQGQAE